MRVQRCQGLPGTEGDGIDYRDGVACRGVGFLVTGSW
jgi:hypothetical protein